MSLLNVRSSKLSDKDLEFLLETVSCDVTDTQRFRWVLEEDEDFRKSFIGDERLFRRVMDDEEIFVKISPALFFEILLRSAAGDLDRAGYTIERTTGMRIPVFDTDDVTRLLASRSLLPYLADMLSSFTRVESYVLSFQVKGGAWKKIRFTDMDLHTLMGFCDAVDHKHRLGFYKRIADICLFVSGIFPDYAEHAHRYPFSGELRPETHGTVRISPEEYEEEGRKFYKLAAEHESSKELDLSETFWALHSGFQTVKKPLIFISENYLDTRRHTLFR